MENPPASEIPSRSGPDSSGINPLNAIRIMRLAGDALCTQLSLYGQLARVEWLEEKHRLMKMLLVSLIGFACTICAMLFIGILVLAYSWETAYRIPAVISLVTLYLFGLAMSWYRLDRLSALGSQTFAATREEFAADIALVKSRL